MAIVHKTFRCAMHIEMGMTILNSRRDCVENDSKLLSRRGPGPENQFVHLRPTLRKRELTVLSAVSALPEEIRTPTAVATTLVRQGIDIPYSSLVAIMRRLEHK